MDTVQHDVAIVGASLGGVAAALGAARQGVSVVLLERTQWVGGQYSAQGVCRPDDNHFVDTTGSTLSYRQFRHAVREHYRQTYPLSAAAKQRDPATFDPGSSGAGFAVEPLIAHGTMLEMLHAAKVEVLLGTAVSDVELAGDAVAAVIASDAGGTQTRYAARMFLDATDLGDLLPLAKAEYRLGAEGEADFGEANAPPSPHRDWIQPFSIVFALEHRPYGEKHVVPKPVKYDKFVQDQGYTIEDGSITTLFGSGENMWNYRQFIEAGNFTAGFPHDLTTINTGSTDYQSASLPAATAAEEAAIVERARQAALGYLYWLQTTYKREDGRGAGYPELMLRPDIFNTDGTAPQPYIRESRRIQAITTVVQQDIDAQNNLGPRALAFPDSCGIGAYAMDVHKFAKTKMPWSGSDAKPFQVPARALVPIRVTNLLAACKNLGVSHIASGAYRVHPVEWNIGESAGSLAAFAVKQSHTLRGAVTDGQALHAYQHLLLSAGIPLYWWSDVTYERDPKLFAATHLLAVRGILTDGPNPGDPDDLSFGAELPLTALERRVVEARAHRFSNGKVVLKWPTAAPARGEAAVAAAQQLGLSS